MQFILIRHTTVAVPAGICYGQTDVDITSTFEEEATLIKLKLTEMDYDILYTSPMKRCMKLARFIAAGHIIRDNALLEMNFGDWEQQHWNDIYDNKDGKTWFNDYTSVRCPGGESFEDLVIRVSRFITMLKQKHDGKKICIVTHGGVIRAFMAILKNMKLQDTFKQSIQFGEIIHFN